MEKIIICTIKSWNIVNANKFLKKFSDKYQIYIITQKEDFTLEVVKKINPRFIFFPHWSYKIREEVYNNYECVVFHMTDLPFGRGGSPLQNLIERGIYDTKISAIKVVETIDGGPIYCKEDLELKGSAQNIYERCSEIIFTKMLPRILKERMYPVEQNGECVVFQRRKLSQSKIPQKIDDVKLYDYIRMLDAEGYPKAFIEFGNYNLELSNAEIIDGKVTARVVFVKK